MVLFRKFRIQPVRKKTVIESMTCVHIGVFALHKTLHSDINGENIREDEFENLHDTSCIVGDNN